MAQHDYIIANQSGAAFRSDLNNGLAAIVSQNSGAAQPSTTYAYQWWADTTTGLLKIRNAANNAWITIGTLADANLGLLSLAGGTLTGALLADDSGTAALPAIAFDGDTNTGIFRAGADQLGIATNGVERVEFGTSEVVFNDGGADIDFRVEGDTKANLFKVDAGADAVSIDGNFSVTGSFDIASLNGGPLAGTRNCIINGDMRIDQRNAGSGAAVGTGIAGTYGPDRFYGYTGTVSVWTTSRVSTGNTDFPFANRLQRANGSSSTSPIYWRHIIESANCSYLAGQTVTLSFYVTAGADYSGNALQVSVFTGTASDEGAAVLNAVAWTSFATPVNSSITPTTTRTRYTFTATLGATVQEVAIGITFTPSGTAGANDFIDITGVQLEPGSVATPFERRPIGTELALCQRYFAIIYVSLRGTSITGFLEYTAKFPQTMRVVPSSSAFSHPSYTALNVSSEIVRQWSSSEIGYGINGIGNTDMYVLGRGYFLSAEL